MRGMATERVTIVGGGLSGLAAAWQLSRHGVACVVLEARTHLGGRVRTVPFGGGQFDLGPSWVWPGQNHVAALLDHFGLATYEQNCEGDWLYQPAAGVLHRNVSPNPMLGARRIQGGTSALVEALAGELPHGVARCGAVVKAVNIDAEKVDVQFEQGLAAAMLPSEHVALALPPRLVAELDFAPGLGEEVVRALTSTPTWMAGQAKFVATYEAPFWRAAGLSGTAFSRSGPLGEVHDASPEQGGPGALMGFFGVDAKTRAGWGDDLLIEKAVAQLSALFGAPAARPLYFELMDWSREALTATPADAVGPQAHPAYRRSRLPAGWEGRLHLLGAEYSPAHGGLIEGALEQGIGFANRILAGDSRASTRPRQR